jgi:hypothetical protein
MDAVLLAGPGAASAIIGNRRIAVHGPSGPLPTAIVPRDETRPPVTLTPDPDGAPDRAAVIVQGIAWNPATLLGTLRETLGPAARGTIGIDAASPGGLALLREALPDAHLVDASEVVTAALVAKGERELSGLARACVIAHAAAAEAAGGLEAMVRALDGAFPIADLVAEPERVVVDIAADGFAGVARLGPGDADALGAAVQILGESIGDSFGELADRLPAGVEVGGLGRGHELPRLGKGHSHPAAVTLPVGAVFLVVSGAAGVTVVVSADGPRLLSPAPAEVVR